MTDMRISTTEEVKRILEALERWYGWDNEDWIYLRRSEVGELLEEVGRKPK